MNQDDALVAVLDLVRAALAVPVHTESGEDGIHVPGVVFSNVRSIEDQRRHGHQTYAGVTTDGAGTENGYERHFYYWLEVELVARSDDEEEADDLQRSIWDALNPYVDDARGLHADACELRIGQARRGVDALREPDWHESVRSIRLLYLQRVTTTADALASIDEVLDPTL